LSAPVLLESPTVAGLAPRLVSQRERSAPTVVQLRTGSPLGHGADAGTPFFCVAGGGSPATSLRALAELIEDRPCYGIQARGLEERALPDRSVEACARRYLAEIRAIQLSGPYLIGGFSFGGLVAFEMACQLQAAGEQITLLAIIDTTAPGRRPNAAARRAERLEGTSLAAKLRKVPRAITGRAQLSFELASAGLLRRRLRQYRVFFLLSRRAGERYRPSARFDGPALVVHASIRDADEPHLEEPDLGWGPFLRGRVTTTEVTGDHLGIMRRPHVATLGRELGRALDDHGAGS
ncbi:MAG: alpha/beta fold hydrolase, partial [Acidimicrobiia bacterium]